MQHLLIATDPRLAFHLEAMPHLESPRRLHALRQVLEHSLKGIRECGLSVLSGLCDINSFDAARLAAKLDVNPMKIPYVRKTFLIHKAWWPV